MPLGAMVARDDVMDWPSGSHASTFGGNPVSCQAALATIRLLETSYIANAAERGKQLQNGLLRLQKKLDHIGDVRGLGLMVAADVVEDKASLTPDPVLRDEIVQTAFQRGLLLRGCGESALRFCPPLCITAEQVETALGILAAILTAQRPERIAV